MQTKHQIQHLLSTAGIRPNKKLGQHFLIDLNLMRLLVDSASIQRDDVVLEVGCGTGSLTEALAENAGYVIAVEYDPALVAIAKNQLAEASNVELINVDILRNKNFFSPILTAAVDAASKWYAGRILLVSNLPYNVASPVMINLVTGPVIADAMFVTVQKEVADRMIAMPGNSDYGTLSILLGATGRIKLLRTLKPTVFWPEPQVDSAMISFMHDNKKLCRIDDIQLFAETVGLFMSHRRKTLKACIRLACGRLDKVNWHRVFELCNISDDQRPDQLSPQDYICMATLCRTQLMD